MTTLHESLEHLSNDEMHVFYQRYLVETASVLIKEYNLHPKLKSKIYSLIPEIELNIKCKFCESTTYWAKLVNKTHYQSGNLTTIGKCMSCNHHALVEMGSKEIISDLRYCPCEACKARRAEETQKSMLELQQQQAQEIDLAREKRIRLINDQKINPRYIPFSEDTEQYDLDDVTTLMALMFARWDGSSSKENIDSCISQINDPSGLLPTNETSDEHPLAKFYRSRLVRIDFNNTSMDTITEGENGDYKFIPYECSFLTNFKDANETPLDIKETYEFLARKFADGYWYKEWNDQLLSAWITLGVSECIEYAKLKADEYNFGFDSEVKISEIVRELLHEYSVSECFYFISVAYWNAASFAQSNKSHGRKHAENTVPGKLMSLARSGKSKKWDRPKELPRSVYSQMLFDLILNSNNDAGFYLSPGKNYYRLTDKNKVLWPIRDDEEASDPITIIGSEGLYDFLGRIVEQDARVSNDSVAMQLAHLSIIAEKLGLVKAAIAIDQKLMSNEDRHYRNSLLGGDEIANNEY